MQVNFRSFLFRLNRTYIYNLWLAWFDRCVLKKKCRCALSTSWPTLSTKHGHSKSDPCCPSLRTALLGMIHHFHTVDIAVGSRIWKVLSALLRDSIYVQLGLSNHIYFGFGVASCVMKLEIVRSPKIHFVITFLSLMDLTIWILKMWLILCLEYLILNGSHSWGLLNGILKMKTD